MATTDRCGVTGCFCVRPGEIASRRRKLCSGGSLRHTAVGPQAVPASDVSGRVKATSNLGRAVAAGVVTGARRGPPGGSKAQSGSGPRVGEGVSPARALQGSGGLVCVPTGGAWHTCNDENGDGSYPSRGRAGGQGSSFP